MNSDVLRWYIGAHPVTDDPHLFGDVSEGLCEWGGTITAHIENHELIVRGYDPGTSMDEPDYEARGNTLDEAVRLIIGSALVRAGW